MEVLMYKYINTSNTIGTDGNERLRHVRVRYGIMALIGMCIGGVGEIYVFLPMQFCMNKFRLTEICI
jgi:hypothetical protein